MDIPEAIKKHEPFWGAWCIDSFIGAGGFGSVYKIRREGFGETHYCALKHIQIPNSEDEVRQMIEEGADDDTLKSYFEGVVGEIYSEIRLMEKLKGTSHIVSYEDYQIVSKSDGIGYDIYIRMEYLTELKKHFGGKSVTKADIIKLGIDLCVGLELCQQYNIIHRDIKPDNIYVSPSGNYKLGDFGVSRQIDKTMAATRIGTPDYMAPEIYKGENYNSAVDIYSVGLVMYRYLNGNRMPFMPPYPEKFTAADRERAFASRLAGRPFPPPQGAEGRLAEIVLKACSYDMRERYSSPMLMRMELEKIRYTEEEKGAIYPEGDILELDSKSSGEAKNSLDEYAPLPNSGRGTEPLFAKQKTDKANEAESAKNELEIPVPPPADPIPEKPPKKRFPALAIGIAATFFALALVTTGIFIVVNTNSGNNGNGPDSGTTAGNELKLEDTLPSPTEYPVENLGDPSKESEAPTSEKNTEPTISSTPEPTEKPTVAETTAAPSTAKTEPPKTTQAPTTAAPTEKPPTVAPTTQPPITTAAPTQPPTPAPTQPPTQKPTPAPTQPPTPAPTQPPTQKPTPAPTQPPTPSLTQPPTPTPTQPPTQAPTPAPTQPPPKPTTPPTTEPPVSKITIAGKEYSTDLTYLTLEDVILTNTDVESLKYMTNLVGLGLSGNQISDINSLKNLTNLTELVLVRNKISNTSALKGLTNLTKLALYDNQISDISALNGLTNLTFLSLFYNQISDISALKNLTKLTTLYLGNNQISDISALKNLTKLTTLHLSSNRISDISALKNLTNLKELYLGGNPLSESQIAELQAALPNCSIDYEFGG